MQTSVSNDLQWAMMTTPTQRLSTRIERYLNETLHQHATVTPFKGSAQLPIFIERLYELFELRITQAHCFVLAARESSQTPLEIAKHVSLVRSALNAVVIFGAESLAPHNRSRLIAQGIGFVVPGNQLYVPELAVDLRERFRTSTTSRHIEGLSPAAQAVLFRHLLRRNTETTAASIAQRLHYSSMSVGRAFDELAGLKIAEAERVGREKHLRFNASGKELLDLARPFLRTPVRALKYVESIPKRVDWKRAGESALAELTALSPPRINTHALPANTWPTVSEQFNLVEVANTASDFAIETWTYDPATLSDTRTVDPLSLYVQFSDSPDERLAMAAESLLEQIEW